MGKKRLAVLTALSMALVMAGCGGGDSTAVVGAVPIAEPAATAEETQCVAAGWQRLVVNAAGLQRVVLWKAPATGWSRGALVVLHGGGGQNANFCHADTPIIASQVRLTDMALAQGFAVFLPDSSDLVTDDAARPCGKVWDDEVRARANIDLPLFEQLLGVTIPGLRPLGSQEEIFMAGHSSGGYMTVRTATKLANLVTAFAPVSSGDPYGWFRDCTPLPVDRPNVFGAGFDLETRLEIVTPGACNAVSHPNEKPWDGAALAARPAWRAFHHVEDGIADASCVDKVRGELSARGYPETPPFSLTGGIRSIALHYWMDDYNQPLLDFFSAQVR